MPDQAQQDQQLLDEAHGKGGVAVLAAWLKLSGPGWLQSALTLGGGSLAGSMFLGVIGGYEMLWVQLLAMILGVIMLGAISYVTLTIESSPFEGMRRHVNPALAWAWLLGTLAANIVWALPQYSLGYGVITDNLFPDLISDPDRTAPKLIISGVLLALVTSITLCYQGRGGVRIYEAALKALVAIIVLSFAGVAIRLTISGQLAWSTILTSLIPNPAHLIEPTSGFRQVLAGIDNTQARAYWTDYVLGVQRQRMIAAASAAVGINMTFLMPYALLDKGWNRKFRGFALFDLGTGLLIPFVIATGCVVIAAASQFHTRTFEGLVIQESGEVIVDPNVRDARERKSLEVKRGELSELLDQRRNAADLSGVPVSRREIAIASMLLTRDTRELSSSLQGILGSTFLADTVFGIGVLAMALSSISLLMLISGFAVCEALAVEHRGWPFRLGMLFPAIGVAWPLLWSGSSKAYLAVIIGTIGYTLLPIALTAFLFMLNSRRLLGRQLPRGRTRIAWNVAMSVALAITGTASLWTAWQTNLYEFPIGKCFVVGFAVLVIAGHLMLRRPHVESTTEGTQ